MYTTEMKLIYYNILKLKKTENTKSILIISPIARLQNSRFFSQNQ